MASWWGHLSIAFMLLDFALPEGADPAAEARTAVNKGNNVGLTPLHFAVWGRRSSIMQVLLQHDADINVRSGVQIQPDILLPCPAGSTPLHLAAARGSVEICKRLLTTHYARGVEPLMLQRGSAAAAAAASVATADDPRMQINDIMQMPYQIAQRMGFAPLAMLLRPTISLARLFGELERNAPRIYGAPSLKTIATEALNRRLSAVLHRLITEAEAKAATADLIRPISVKKQSARPLPSELVVSAEEDAAAGPLTSSPVSVRSPLHAASSPQGPTTPSQVALLSSRPSSARQQRHRGSPTRSAAPLAAFAPHPEEGVLPGAVPDAEDEAGPADEEERALRAQVAQLMADPGATGPGDSDATPHASPSGEAPPSMPPTPSGPAAHDVRGSTSSLPSPPQFSMRAATSEIGYEDDEDGASQWQAKVAASQASQRGAGGQRSPVPDDDVQILEQTEGGVEEEEAPQQSTPAGPAGPVATGGREPEEQRSTPCAVDPVSVVTKTDRRDEECGVCLEALPGLQVAPCNHLLCGERTGLPFGRGVGRSDSGDPRRDALLFAFDRRWLRPQDLHVGPEEALPVPLLPLAHPQLHCALN